MADSRPATPLLSWHQAHGARLVDFAGWNMPLLYDSIVAEHRATRSAAGLFDVSHMARFRFSNSTGEDFLERLLTRRVRGMRPGQVRYSLVANEQGGVLDDVLVARPRNPRWEDYFLLVANAGNREKILAWIARQGGESLCRDETLRTAMLAVQGPRAEALLRPIVEADLAAMKYYTALEAPAGNAQALVSRTGYTGEDGFELVVPAADALELWEQIIAAGRSHGLLSAGLGCRDTLRLEAGMPLYGHELSESIDPFQAGLGFAVDLEDRSFPGAAALAALKGDVARRVRVGWQLSGRRVPREGYLVYHDGEVVGEVTSGTFSPSLDRPIAMGYCRRRCALVGSEVEIDIRAQREKARVVPLPFYRRATATSCQ